MMRTITPRLRHIFIVILVAILLSCSLLSPIESKAEAQAIRIGVLANRGGEKCLEEWAPTAEYLTRRIPGYSFSIVPLSFDAIEDAVGRDEVDFVVANPVVYVNLEVKYQVMRIATMRTNALGKTMVKFGGVIFTQSGRADINGLQDLKGKAFAAVDRKSFGGWVACLDELVRADINPEIDFARLEFLETHDAVVYAVRSKSVDAGTVRTDVLERLAAAGAISLDEFKVLPPITPRPSDSHFQFKLSTRLYPEWAIATTRHVPEDLASKVAAQLLAMPFDADQAKAVQGAGWTVPLNYTDVLDIMKRHRIGVFHDFGDVSVLQFVRQHIYVVVLSLVIAFMLALIATILIQMNKRLALTNEELAQTFETTGNGMRMVDADFTVHRVNRLMVEMSGQAQEAQVGRKCYETFPGNFCNTEQCSLRQILAGSERVESEVLKVQSDGLKVPCIAIATPFHDKNGKVVGMVESYHDITIRKQAEALHEDIESIIRHDLKAPIASLYSGCQMILEGAAKGEDLLNVVRHMKESSIGAMGMITRSMDLLRIERGTYVLKTAELDVMALIGQVMSDQESLSGAKDIKVEVLNRGVPAAAGQTELICAEKSLVYSMLSNLIKNALEASPVGGVVTISVDLLSDALCIAVHNEGAVPEAIRERFFEKYVTAGKMGGTGLGAYSARLMARTHGWDISLDTSREGETTVLVCLPRKETTRS